MKRIGLARWLGVLSLASAAACGDDEGSVTADDGNESESSDDAADDIADDSSGSIDTTDGESSSADADTSGDSGGAICGDDVIDVGEVCDGTDLGGADCVDEGFDRGALGCAADCTAFDTSACTMASCGNDKAEGRESCDGKDLNGHDCLSEGFDGGTVVCAGNCMSFDTEGCYQCGDDEVTGTEVCDGENLNEETCVTQGFASGELACDDDCTGFDVENCSDMPACVEEDIGSEVGGGVAGGTTVGEDENLGQVCASGGSVDYVLLWTAPNDGYFQFDTFGSGYDTSLALYTDCRSPEFACNDDTNGLQSRLATVLLADEQVIISVNGYNAAVGDWVLSITEIPTGGPCCEPHAEVGCDDIACTDTVCGNDPFCCETEWDQACTNQALVECTPCTTPDICGNGVLDGMPLEACDGIDFGGQTCETAGFDFGTLDCPDDCSVIDVSGCGDSGDCCTDNGPATPGCTDDSCEAIICATNPNCCFGTWDATCAALAATDCAVCNPGVCGNNLVDAVGEVCDGVDIGAEDCASQGSEFGELGCADDCSGYDTAGCFAAGEDCCTDFGLLSTPGCSDAACNDAVCAADPFCCMTDWDSSCVNVANGLCGTCEGGQGDCCTDVGDVGCSDATCTNQICGFGGLDATCCSVSWTAACTDLANANCAVCA